MFLHMSVILSTGMGGHAWLLQGVRRAWLLLGGREGMRGCSGGMHGCLGGVHGCLGGCVWLLWGGMHGCSRGGIRGCSGGCAWLLHGVCVCGCLGGAWLLGGCMVALGGMHGCLGGCAWLLWGGACVVALRGHAWDTMRYGDTVNERAVRILLECILVIFLTTPPPKT